MAYPQGSSITKSNMISDFNTLVITARNNSIIWAAGEGNWSIPGGTTGDPFYPNNLPTPVVQDRPVGPEPASNTFTFVSGSANPLGARTAGQVSTGALTDLIGATNIYNAFVTVANAATNIRSVNLIKYFNVNGSYQNVWEYTRVGAMNSSYLTSVSTSSDPNSGSLVAATQLDGFVNSMVSSMNSIKNIVAAFQEYYCHSSCHGSCHTSRGRR